MKREHKLEALCVDGSIISFDQIVALRGRIIRTGSWHYLQVPGEPERAVVLRPTLRESLRQMGDYAARKRKDKPNYAFRGQRKAVVMVDECGPGLMALDPKTLSELVAPKLTPFSAKIVRQMHPDLYELPHVDNLRMVDGEPDGYSLV
jgi:hypothetical protein